MEIFVSIYIRIFWSPTTPPTDTTCNDMSLPPPPPAHLHAMNSPPLQRRVSSNQRLCDFSWPPLILRGPWPSEVSLIDRHEGFQIQCISPVRLLSTFVKVFIMSELCYVVSVFCAFTALWHPKMDGSLRRGNSLGAGGVGGWGQMPQERVFYP